MSRDWTAWPRADPLASWDAPDVGSLALANPHPRDRRIGFRAEGHAYFVDVAEGVRLSSENAPLASVSRLIGGDEDAATIGVVAAARRVVVAGVKPPFLGNVLAKACAKKHARLAHEFAGTFGDDPDEETTARRLGEIFGDYASIYHPERSRDVAATRVVIEDKWKTENGIASALGTATHAAIERILNDVAIVALRSKIRSEGDDGSFRAAVYALEGSAPEIVQFVDYLLSDLDWEPYRTEWAIFDEARAFTGTIDLVYRRVSTGKFGIKDWKRCKDIFDKKRPCGKLGGPLEGTSRRATRAEIYAIQLNLYAEILRVNYGIEVEDRMEIVSVHPVQSSFVEIPCVRNADFVARILVARAISLATLFPSETPPAALPPIVETPPRRSKRVVPPPVVRGALPAGYFDVSARVAAERLARDARIAEEVKRLRAAPSDRGEISSDARTDAPSKPPPAWSLASSRRRVVDDDGVEFDTLRHYLAHRKALAARDGAAAAEAFMAPTAEYARLVFEGVAASERWTTTAAAETERGVRFALRSNPDLVELLRAATDVAFPDDDVGRAWTKARADVNRKPS